MKNPFEQIGLKRVVNASGRMTALGVSTLSDEVAQATISGGQNYVEITSLYEKVGEIVSRYTQAEDSCVTSCASAGICMSVAGIISKGNRTLMERLPDSSGLANEIIIQKGHCVQFGAPVTTMIALGGGKVVEVGLANETACEHVVDAITEKTAALIYIKSHHCIQKGMLSLDEMIRIGHEHNLPVIVDAAAEEDLRIYVAKGADLVIYSGAKAFEATTSGIITGKKQYVEYARKQFSGIGRPMKVGKENIMGLLKALELYENKDHVAEVNRNVAIVDYLVDEINKISGLSATKIRDEAGREIWRAQVKVDEKRLNMNASQMEKVLREGNPSIHTRRHLLNLGYISFDARPMIEGDKELIIARLKEITGE